MITDNFVSDSSAIPNAYLTKKSKGIKVLDEQSNQLHPVNNFPDKAINETSENLIQKHLQAVKPNGAIREQVSAFQLAILQQIYCVFSKLQFLSRKLRFEVCHSYFSRNIQLKWFELLRLTTPIKENLEYFICLVWIIIFILKTTQKPATVVAEIVQFRNSDGLVQTNACCEYLNTKIQYHPIHQLLPILELKISSIALHTHTKYQHVITLSILWLFSFWNFCSHNYLRALYWQLTSYASFLPRAIWYTLGNQ